MITINDILDIDYDRAVEVITGFIEEMYSKTGVRGLVVGLSGGIDSSTTLKLVSLSIPAERITALIMPDTDVTPQQDVRDALSLARDLGVKYYLVDIKDIVKAYSILPFYGEGDRLPIGNLRARIRMNILYYYANKHRYLVVGTGDRSELFLGYFTKYGDGGVDILPIGSLYKTQVRQLAKHLGLPESITSKPSSPQLWRGHLAEEELGMRYEEIDLILYALMDKGIPAEKIPEETGVGEWMVRRVLEMHRSTRHKRMKPPIPKLPWVREPIIEF